MKGITYDIDRHNASELLSVSTRTLDRYIRMGKLHAKKIRGRVLLSQNELAKLSEEESVMPVSVAITRRGDKSSHERSDTRAGITSHERSDTRAAIISHERGEQPYKNLYDESVSLLKDKETKLEQALYRIGQLESQVGNNRYPISAPTSGSDISAMKVIQQNLEIAEKQLEQLQKRFKYERTNRLIITSILYVLLVLQPVFWYVMRGSLG